MVKEQTEIQGLSLTDWQEDSGKWTTLLTDRAVPLSTAKATVFSDSVLCIGRIPHNPVSTWKEKIDWFMNLSQCRELDRIDGEPMDIFSQEIQKMTTETQCEFEQFPGRIFFMSKYNDIEEEEIGNEELCIAKFKIVADCAERFADIGRFLGLGQKRNGTELIRTNRMANGIESLRT